MSKCRQCGEELPKYLSVDICLECSEKNVRQIFKEHPDIKDCFKKTIANLKAELKAGDEV